MKTSYSILLFAFFTPLLFVAVIAVGGASIVGNRLNELKASTSDRIGELNASTSHSLAALEKRCDAVERSIIGQPTEELPVTSDDESSLHQHRPEDAEEARSDIDELAVFHFATSDPSERHRALNIKQRLYAEGEVTDEQLRFLLLYANEEMRLRIIATAFDEHMQIFGDGGPAEYSASLAFALASTDDRRKAANLKRRLDAGLSLNEFELVLLSQFAIGETKQRIKGLLILDYNRQFGF